MAIASKGVTVRDILESLQKDGRKSFAEYNGNKIIKLYEAVLHVAAGEPCLVTETAYTVEGLVEKQKEYVGVWPVGADI